MEVEELRVMDDKLGQLYRLCFWVLVRAECVPCPWLQAETKVATILGIFSFLVVLGGTVVQNPINPTINPSGRKVCGTERKRNRKIIPNIVDTSFRCNA